MWSVEISTVMNTNTFLSHRFFCVPSPSSGLKSRISLAEKPEDAENQSVKERVQPWGGGRWKEPEANVGTEDGRQGSVLAGREHRGPGTY